VAIINFFEEALQSGKGHWPSYIGDIATAFRQAGHQAVVLAHRQADPALLAELKATPWFSRNCWTEPSRQGGLGGLRHSLRYGREVSAWLRRHRHVSWVCAPTMRLQHLLAFSFLCRRPLHRGHRRYLLLFVQGFGEYQGPGLPVAFPATASARLAHWCFRRLAQAVRSGRVVLAAETRAMQAELEAFSQLPVCLFPHPVSLPAETSTPYPRAAELSNSGITITCPGFARYEKGNDLLQEACRQLFADEPKRDLQVISQWPQPFTLPDGSQAAPDPTLLAGGRFILINHSLHREAYAALLARSDLIVLPYRRSSYHNRVSRVAIEAALHGIPLVYMSGTWCEEVVEITGAGVAIAEETPEAVTAALQAALDQLPFLRLAALNAKALVAEQYSAQRFRQLLMEC
jgi:glycosyltransferase involved in cell wall biosynthesis